MRRFLAEEVDGRLRGFFIGLSVVSMILCASALLLPWYNLEKEFVYSEASEGLDRIAQYEFLVTEMWFTLSSPEADLLTSHYSYDDDLYSPNVGRLFSMVGLLCILCIVAIAVSIMAFILRIRKIVLLSAPLALGLSLGALIVFSIGFPQTASAEISSEIEGLFGSKEVDYESLSFTLTAKWGVSYAWWLMIGAASTMLVQIILVMRVPGIMSDSE